MDFRTQVSSKLAEYSSFIIPIIDDLYSKGLMSDETIYLTKDKINNSEIILNDLFINFDNGDRLACYNKLRKLLAVYEGNINNSAFTYVINKNQNFYRIRPDRISDGRHRHNIFHIPFKLRHLVSNLRFNPPGIPCLYCSNDLHTASGEFDNDFKLYDSIDHVDNDNRDALNVALFINSRELSCLDLSLRNFQALMSNAENDMNAFLNYCILFPFIMLLHCKQDFSIDQSVSFRMEYMLPSFMMTWIFNQIGKGFKYFSGKSIEAFKYSSVKSVSPLTSHNFVFPSYYSSDLDYCIILENVFLKNYHYIYTDELKALLGKEIVDESDYATIQSYILGKMK